MNSAARDFYTFSRLAGQDSRTVFRALRDAKIDLGADLQVFRKGYRAYCQRNGVQPQRLSPAERALYRLQAQHALAVLIGDRLLTLELAKLIAGSQS